jgi:hypothetical protein
MGRGASGGEGVAPAAPTPVLVTNHYYVSEDVPNATATLDTLLIQQKLT